MNILQRTKSFLVYFYSKKQDLYVQNNNPIHIIGDLTCCCEPLENYICVELIPTENNTAK